MEFVTHRILTDDELLAHQPSAEPIFLSLASEKEESGSLLQMRRYQTSGEENFCSSVRLCVY
jgi:hypothetical protein